LNIYYAIYQDRHRSISIGTGLSSYLMLTEEYGYDYGQYNSLHKSVTIKNKNQHFLSILNLSATYSGNLNRKWSWQVEPYYKLPLTGIAEADVKLKSVGLYLSLKYKL
jgi:hypothetical protein